MLGSLAVAAAIACVVAARSPVDPTRSSRRDAVGPPPTAGSVPIRRARPLDAGDLAAKIARLSDLSAGPERLAASDAIREELGAAARPLSAEVREVLLRALATAPDDLLPAIASLLGELRGDRDAARSLVRNLQRESLSAYSVRAHLQALGSIGAVEVVPDLLALLDTPRPEGSLIVEAVARIDADGAPERFAAMLPGALPASARRLLEAALVRSAQPELVRELGAALEGCARPEARRSMLRILAGAGSIDDVPRVLACLGNESDPAVRSEAVRTLGKLGGPKSAQRLWELSAAFRPERRAAVFALQDLRGASAFEAVLPHWDTTEPDARRAVLAAAATDAATARLLATRAADALADEAIEERTLALRVLIAAGDAASIDRLRRHGETTPSIPELRRVLQALQAMRSAQAAQAGRPLVERLPELERARFLEAFDRALDGDP